MAYKDRQSEVSEKSSERRHRTKTDKDSERSHKSRSSKSKVIDPETGEPVKSRRRKKDGSEVDKVKKRVSEPNLIRPDLVPELSRAPSRISLPYPNFNKAHSREAVRIARDDVKLTSEKNPITPESTDLGSDEKLGSKSTEQLATESRHEIPPSPPETDVSKKKPGQRQVSQAKQPTVEEEKDASRVSSGTRTLKREGNPQSTAGSKVLEATNVSVSSLSSEDSSGDTITGSELSSRGGSNATSVPQKHNRLAEETTRKSSRNATPSSSSKPPTTAQDFVPQSAKPIPPPFIHFKPPDLSSNVQSAPQNSTLDSSLNVPRNIPCVDYLMENGGLSRPVSKRLFGLTQSASHQNSSQQITSVPPEVQKIFGPYFKLLGEYETVLSKNGSLAVATGYRSVARRLLDRLEVVMGRDLAEEGCLCIMCQNEIRAKSKRYKPLGWGEVLEWSAGRKQLPTWPAFDFAALGVKAIEMTGFGQQQQNSSSSSSPVKVDPDIADEFREYYLQQSKKTKLAVDRWLSSCHSTTATPPQEVDDETLSFAILTHLDKHERPIFNALSTGSTVLQPLSRLLTSVRKPRSEFIMRTVQSIQRLYRLPLPPRDPEAAIYLLKNPELHDLLATISEISSREWEILTSGRFDGFLWSGADTESVSSTASRSFTLPNGTPQREVPSPGINQSWATSRNSNPTPSINSTGSSSRGQPVYIQTRRPVLNDEETEIAVLAEVEREIYVGMEALEDAFENLHRKAELVRRALRERGAGITKSLQSRQLSQSALDILDGPMSGSSSAYGRQSWGDRCESQSVSDWDPGDEYSELAPDDSASNISSSRHRRPKRRNERMVPVLFEDDDEE